MLEELFETDLGVLEDLGQGRPLHLSGMVGHREVHGPISGVGEMVMAAFNMVEQIPRILKGPDDLSGLERGNAGAHTALDSDRYPLGDGAPEFRLPFDGDGFLVLLQNLQVAPNGFLDAITGFGERITFRDHPGEHGDRDRVAAFGGRLKQDRVGVHGRLDDLRVEAFFLGTSAVAEDGLNSIR